MSPRQGTVVALASLALAGCGGGETGGSNGADGNGSNGNGGNEGAPSSVTVSIADFKYAPPSARVARGGVVRFVNRDRASHTATAEQGFDTGRLKQGESGEVRPDKAGSIAYICSFHPYMKAVVEVE